MMILDSWNPVFRVKFEIAPELNDEFETKAEALEYAQANLSKKPVVLGVEILLDDFGTVIEESDPEEIYNYATEVTKPEEPEVKLDRLAELEAEINKTEESGSEESGEESSVTKISEISEVPSEEKTDVVNQTEISIDNIKYPEEEKELDPYNFVGEIEIPAEVKPEDSFGCTFSDLEDISADEASHEKCLDPVTFMSDLADSLGIGDEVSITPVADDCEAFPEPEKIEVCDSGWCDFPEPKDSEINTVSPVDFTLGDVSEEPKVELVVKTEVPETVIDQISDSKVSVSIPVSEESGDESKVITESAINEDSEMERHKKIARNFALKIKKQFGIDESLEETVPEDLEDDRTPVEESGVEIKSDPFNYKAEVSKQKCLDEFYDHKDRTIESDQKLAGTDNAVVPCEKEKVIAHSEDEKPVDCKMEEKPLTQPLAGDFDPSELWTDEEFAKKLSEAIKEKNSQKK